MTAELVIIYVGGTILGTILGYYAVAGIYNLVKFLGGKRNG